MINCGVTLKDSARELKLPPKYLVMPIDTLIVYQGCEFELTKIDFCLPDPDFENKKKSWTRSQKSGLTFELVLHNMTALELKLAKLKTKNSDTARKFPVNSIKSACEYVALVSRPALLSPARPGLGKILN